MAKMMKEREQQKRIISTPDPVEGRKHLSVQTEKFLEEIKDQLVEADVETQTDAFKDRPPSPLFVPKKSGIDRHTQVEDGELFDFDYEVEPILEVLVGKTLEQSIMEVMEEEELLALKTHQDQYESLRNAELAQTQKLEAAERRRWEEKERRKQQEKERIAKELQAKERVMASQMAKTFLSNLEDKVFGQLANEGYFYDQVEREVEFDFLPWLMQRVGANLDTKRVSRALADDLIKNALRTCLARAQQARDERQRRIEEEQARIRKEEEDRRLKLMEEELLRAAEEEETRRKAEADAAAAAADDADPDAAASAAGQESEQQDGDQGGEDASAGDQ